MPYTPPTGNQVRFNFSGTSWTPPAGNEVEFRIGEPDDGSIFVYPDIGETLVFGSTICRNHHEFVSPPGTETLVFGMAYILYDPYPSVPGHYAGFDFNGAAYTVPDGNQIGFFFDQDPGTLYPAGLDSFQAGSATIANTTLSANNASVGETLAIGSVTVSAGNPPITTSVFDSMVFASPWISHYNRTAAPSGIEGAFGSTHVDNSIRLIQLNSRGIDPGPFGSCAVQLLTRYLEPPWFSPLQWGLPLIGFDIQVPVSGFDASLFGTTFVHDTTQFTEASGIASATFGGHEIYQLDRQVYPVTMWDSDESRIPVPVIFNKRQYIEQEYIETQWNLGGFGEYTHIYNENRVLDLVGNGIAPPYLQVPIGHDVRNNAVGVTPSGIDSLSIYSHLVAYENRTVPATSWFSEIIGEYLVVFNDAYAINPVGFQTDAVGTPESVVNTRRYFPYIGVGYDTSEFGTPFIADAIRSMTPLQEVGPETWGGQTVWFKVREIAPAGFQYTPFGIPALDVHFNIVRPNTIPPVDLYGTPSIHNATPFIGPYWDESLWTLFGDTAIFNRNNYYDIQGFGGPVFGLHYIADRKQTVQVPGFTQFRLENKHVVRNETPDPPGAQNVSPGGFVATGYGGTSISSNSIFTEVFSAALFGNATIYINSVFPMGIAPPRDGPDNSEVGTPSVNPTQFVEPTIDETMEFSKPRLSPYTIYAPIGAPQQAKDNHPPGLEEPIDDFLGNGSMPVWGRPEVSNKNRAIYPTAALDYLRIGNHAISVSPQFVLPDGIKSFKYGIPFTNAGLEIVTYGSITEVFGDHHVAHIEPLHRSLFATGFIASAWGNQIVSNFIRYYEPAGMDSARFGTTWVQRPPPPAEPDGFVATLWGDAMVAYRIRHVQVQVFDTFECDDTPGQFDERMRVIGLMPLIQPVGFDSAAMGTPGAGLATRHLGVQGIDVVPIAVSVPSLRKQNIIAMAGHGFDSAIFGDVQKWEAGKIKPQGQDFFDAGLHLLSRTIVDVSLGSIAQLPSPSVANSIGVGGLNTAEYGQAVAMAFGCGRQARAIVGWENVAFGAHGVLGLISGTHQVVGFDSLAFGTATVTTDETIGLPGDDF